MQKFFVSTFIFEYLIYERLYAAAPYFVLKVFHLRLFAEKPFLLANKKAPKTGLFIKTQS